MENSMTAPADPFALLVESITERIIAAVKDRLVEPSLWLNKDEAVLYTRLPKGTFEKLVTNGRIPSHGGRARVFNRQELDRALASM